MADKVLEPESANLSGEWKRNAAAAAPEETKFLQGPQPRKFEFWQVMRICRELIYGFRKLHFVGPCVTVFGSARFDENHLFYRQARLIGRRLTPDLYHLVVAAKQTAGDDFALALAETARAHATHASLLRHRRRPCHPRGSPPW